MRIRRYGSLVLVALFAATVASCGGSSTGPQPSSSDLGSFEINYSGDESGTLSGPAFFNELEFEGSDDVVAFSIFGVEVENEDNGFGLGRLTPQPGPGTYDISGGSAGDAPEGAFGMVISVETKNLSVEATDGSVTIDESGPDRVSGSFEATLEGFRQGTVVTISATGTFDAVSCQDNVENCPSTLPGS